MMEMEVSGSPKRIMEEEVDPHPHHQVPLVPITEVKEEEDSVPYFDEDDVCSFAISPEQEEGEDPHHPKSVHEDEEVSRLSSCLFCLQNESVPWKGREGDVISYLNSMCTLLNLPIPRYEKEQLLSFKGPRYCGTCQRWIKEIKGVLDKLKDVQKQLRGKTIRLRKRRALPIQKEKKNRLNLPDGDDDSDNFKYPLHVEIKEEQLGVDGNPFIPKIIIEEEEENCSEWDSRLRERIRKDVPSKVEYESEEDESDEDEESESEEEEESDNEQSKEIGEDVGGATDKKLRKETKGRNELDFPLNEEEFGDEAEWEEIEPPKNSTNSHPHPTKKKRKYKKMKQGEDEDQICRSRKRGKYNRKRRKKNELVNDHDKMEKFHCPTCNYPLGSEFSLQVHIRKKHEGDPTPYHCPFPGCSKKFTNRGSYGYHKSMHAGIRPFVCNICNKAFPAASGLRQHNVVSHPNEESKVKCDVCEKTFSTKTRLMNHMYTHSKKYPFICEVCGKGYAMKTSLEDHVLVKHGDNPFHCHFPDCGKSFCSRYYMKEHEASHVEPKAFMCETCGKTFSNARSVKIHKLSHISMDQRKCVCSICGARFQRSSCLRRHMKRHEGIKNFSCDICGKSFVTRDKIKSHKKETHERGIQPRNKGSMLEKMQSSIASSSITNVSDGLPPGYQMPQYLTL